MSTNEVISVIPPKEHLLGVTRNVSCTEEGCVRIFVHDGALKMHLVMSHGKIETDSDRRLFNRGKKEDRDTRIFHFHCPEVPCHYNEGSQRHFTTFKQLKQHYMKVHAEKKFVCTKCQQCFSLERVLRQHSEHCGVLFQCGTCPVKYTTREVLQTHCKRQTHTYPDVYRRKDREKDAQKRKRRKTNTDTTVPLVTRVPVILIAVTTPPQAPPKPLQPIKPKLVVSPKPVNTGSKFIIQDKVNGYSQGHVTLRQDALIQTDIYGVSSLSVSGRDRTDIKANNISNADSNLHGQIAEYANANERSKVMTDCRSKFAIDTSFRSPPKKHAAVKRKQTTNYIKDHNQSSPRRKKMKSTTGIQTSVSLTQRKSLRTVSGTQTTGDYILKTAMANANIPIERKTVASQVTPEKPRNTHFQINQKCTSETQTMINADENHLSESSVSVRSATKPALVDSCSQVKQRHIWAETSHNLAERQTMTDLPPSISTQTLQSYLVNVQERSILPKKQLNSSFTAEHMWEPQYPGKTTCTGPFKTTCTGPSKTTCTGNETILIGNPDNFVINSRSTKPTSQDASVNSNFIRESNVVEIYDQNLDSSVSFILPTEQNAGDTYPSNIHKPTASKESANSHAGMNFLSAIKLKPTGKPTERLHNVTRLPVGSSSATQASTSTGSAPYNSEFNQWATQPQTAAEERHQRNSIPANISKSVAESFEKETENAVHSNVLTFRGTSSNNTQSTRGTSSNNTQSIRGTSSNNTQSIRGTSSNNTQSIRGTSSNNTQSIRGPSSNNTQSIRGTSSNNTQSTVLEAKGSTIDTEAQTMSASEFELLLQSSGIFLDNSNFIESSTQGNILPLSSTSQSMDTGLGPEFDFLGNSADTIDMNTQTASDFSLFESYVSIDTGTNTQNFEGLDFLDLVMTNMETQTLNEEDLISLGLANVDSATQSQGSSDHLTNVDGNAIRLDTNHLYEGINVDSLAHSLGVGTGDLGCTDQQTSLTQTCISVTGQDSYLGPLSRSSEVRPLSDAGSQTSTGTGNQFGVKTLSLSNQILQGPLAKAQPTYNLLCDLDEKVMSQSETQTMTNDMTESFLQTETQTQVESHDVDFMTISMETQTTFDGIQQLCSWFDAK